MKLSTFFFSFPSTCFSLFCIFFLHLASVNYFAFCVPSYFTCFPLPCRMPPCAWASLHLCCSPFFSTGVTSIAHGRTQCCQMLCKQEKESGKCTLTALPVAQLAAFVISPTRCLNSSPNCQPDTSPRLWTLSPGAIGAGGAGHVT